MPQADDFNVPPRPASWVRAATDPDAFAREQAALGQVWTVLGLAADVAGDGQWVRTRLGGRSVFVQRFGTELRGFENRCAHRFHPLRTADAGMGPVVCPFHHWRYDKTGRAIGIPVCDDAFGTTPKALDARLRPLEVEVLGGLVFGRFRGDPQAESLADFLGDAAPVLQTLCPSGLTGRRLTDEVPANWKFLTHIGLDEYHLVAVHPSTFGRQGYLKAADVTYARFGRHSLFTMEAGSDPAARIVAACRSGTYQPVNYLILNLFPAFAVSQFHAIDLFGRSWYFQFVYRYVALAPGITRLEGWVMPAPTTPAPRSGLAGMLDRMTVAVASRIVPFYVRRVNAEDGRICIGLQGLAGEMDAAPRLSPAFEGRIGWFEADYDAVVGGAGAPHPPT